MKEHAKKLERELNVAASHFVTEIISRGECIGITRAELDELPKDSWHKYCQHRLTKDHTQALAALRQFRPENATAHAPTPETPNDDE